MQTLVVYDSKFGNTEKVAHAIARGISQVSEVQVMATPEAMYSLAALTSPPDLIFIGGPTQNRGPSQGLREFMEALPATLRGIPVTCFDARYRGPVLLMGSAASAVAKALTKFGAAGLVAPPESFFIVRHGPMEHQTLEPGELERAEAWGRAIATSTRSLPAHV